MSLPSLSGALSKIRTHINTLSASERRVADYVVANRSEVVSMTMLEIAKESGVSDATVLRFVRSIGFDGFSSFKTALAAELMLPNEAVFESIDPKDTYEAVIEKVISSDIKLLQETLATLSPLQLQESVEAIIAARCIYIFAVASSEPMGVWLYDRLFRLGYSVFLITDTYRQLVQSSLAKPEDTFIIISRSGSPITLANAMRTIKQVAREAKIIAIVCDETSRIAQRCDYCLCGVSNEVRSDIAGSIVSMASILNVLYVCIERKDLDKAINNQKVAWDALSILRKIEQ